MTCQLPCFLDTRNEQTNDNHSSSRRTQKHKCDTSPGNSKKDRAGRCELAVASMPTQRHAYGWLNYIFTSPQMQIKEQFMNRLKNTCLLPSYPMFLKCNPIGNNTRETKEGIGYLQSGTLQESDCSHIDEWSLRSCHIRLQRRHPPLTLFLQVAKCLIKSCRPWHVANLLQGPLFFVGPTSYGPTLVHPSVHMCSRHSIASLSCKYKPCSCLRLLVLFILWNFIFAISMEWNFQIFRTELLIVNFSQN